MSEPNPFAVAASHADAIVQIAQSKDAQRIQAAIVVAKKFPRDQHAAFQKIIEACKRRTLAEEASYLYSRGGTQITGASIRLQEVEAQNWGNFQCGVTELDVADGESRMEAFAWDLESNMFSSKTFSVRHERHTKAGVTKLDDPRDIYEVTANFAARRQRSCMEACIPRDVIDAALEQCDKTLKSGHTEPLADRIRKMATAFAEFGVSTEMLEKRLQHKLDATIEQELVLLRKIFTALKDGMGKREDYFDVNVTAPKPAKFQEPKEPVKPKETAPAKVDKAEEAKEAAAGLAPVQPAQPAPTPPAATAPAAPPPSQIQSKLLEPVQPSPEPEPEPEPAATAGSDGELFSGTQQPAEPPPPSLAEQAYAVLGQNKVTEDEVLTVLKVRSICAQTVNKMSDLSQEILADLIANIAIIAAQVRIDKKGRKK
jgi:hypothetical protein